MTFTMQLNAESAEKTRRAAEKNKKIGVRMKLQKLHLNVPEGLIWNYEITNPCKSV